LAVLRPTWTTGGRSSPTPGTHFVSLQYDDCEDEIRAAENRFGIRVHRWPDLDLRNDFENIAALVANLDVVMRQGAMEYPDAN